MTKDPARVEAVIGSVSGLKMPGSGATSEDWNIFRVSKFLAMLDAARAYDAAQASKEAALAYAAEALAPLCQPAPLSAEASAKVDARTWQQERADVRAWLEARRRLKGLIADSATRDFDKFRNLGAYDECANILEGIRTGAHLESAPQGDGT